MSRIAILFLAFFSTASAIELTPETWDEAVEGKTVFIKFFAPCTYSSLAI